MILVMMLLKVLSHFHPHLMVIDGSITCVIYAYVTNCGLIEQVNM